MALLNIRMRFKSLSIFRCLLVTVSDHMIPSLTNLRIMRLLLNLLKAVAIQYIATYFNASAMQMSFLLLLTLFSTYVSVI